jgi:hypothetical protein
MQGYHPVHAAFLDPYWPACGSLLDRSQYRSAHTDFDGGRSSRMDALSHCISSRSRWVCVDGMGLDCHGLRHLWHGGTGLRPRHSRQYSGRKRRDRILVLFQCDERGRKPVADPVRRAGVLAIVPGDRASNIPSSQSSVPFFIFKTLIRSNPASVNQDFVSAAE